MRFPTWTRCEQAIDAGRLVDESEYCRQAPLGAETPYNSAGSRHLFPGGSWRSPPAFGLVRMRSSPPSGLGAWARCTKARDTRLERAVAIKVLAKQDEVVSLLAMRSR